MAKKNKTLKDILDLILYENPSTQDEIANRLGISRRYVTQLIQPLIKDGTIKRAYVIDMKSYEEVAESLGEYVGPKDDSGNVLINDMLYNLWKWITQQITWLKKSEHLLKLLPVLLTIQNFLNLYYIMK